MAKLRDVFIAGGMPRLTYVDREHLNLAGDLQREISEGYKLICVTGPTKSGKTVLCNKVLAESKSLWVPGGQIYDSDDFWKHILDELDLPAEYSTTDSSSLGAGFSNIISIKAKIESGESIKFARSSRKFLLDFMKKMK
ncbi:hypothetical protein [Albimonas donghaensis]|uniref:hypothetical protein n=1 Tax=Albimonas donghaensis TaxID=356660 RepID=UPI00115F8C3C|nr:hypothetical protein [Albimonas donghaensis]